VILKSALKHYWSYYLDELKQNSITSHRTWIAAGRLRFGHIFYCKQDAHYKYKIAVKDAVDIFEDRFNEDMLDCYVRKDLDKFWGCWRRRHGKGLPVIKEVEGKTDNCHIANTFAKFFSIPSLDASQVGRVIDDVSAVQSVSYDVRKWLISVEDVDCAVRNHLKLRKAAGYDVIIAEHIIFAHPRQVVLMCDLFNFM